MHSESWPGIDLNDRAVRPPNRLRYVWRNEVDAGNVQSDHHRRLPGDLDIVGMDIVSPVD